MEIPLCGAHAGWLDGQQHVVDRLFFKGFSVFRIVTPLCFSLGGVGKWPARSPLLGGYLRPRQRGLYAAWFAAWQFVQQGGAKTFSLRGFLATQIETPLY